MDIRQPIEEFNISNFSKGKSYVIEASAGTGKTYKDYYLHYKKASSFLLKNIHTATIIAIRLNTRLFFHLTISHRD